MWSVQLLHTLHCKGCMRLFLSINISIIIFKICFDIKEINFRYYTSDASCIIKIFIEETFNQYGTI